MTKETQSHIIALAGTILSMCLVFLLLWWLQVNAPIQAEDEGIVVAFGDSEDGGGMPDVRPLDPMTKWSKFLRLLLQHVHRIMT